MGRPKAGVEVAGRTLLAHAAGAARGAGLEPFVVAKPGSELPPHDLELVTEPPEPRHPLAGIAAALDHAGGPVVVLACDVPLVPPPLLAELATRTAVLAVPGYPRLQPLVARWSPAALPRLRTALEAGTPVVDLAESLGGDRLGEAELRRWGDPEAYFANVNSPADLARVEEMLSSR